MRTVVDASVVLAWLLPGEGSDHAESVVAGLRAGEAFAPGLLPYEVANGLGRARRRGRITEADEAVGVRLATALPVTTTDVGQGLGNILEVAHGHELTAYDAAYLSAAASLGAALATEDVALRRAAADAGVPLV